VALIRPSTLLLATAISGPAIWSAAVTHHLDPTSAMERFLIAVPVSAVMLAGLRALTASYARRRIANAPVRAEDKEGAPDP
jgi:hypothetical protein